MRGSKVEYQIHVSYYDKFTIFDRVLTHSWSDDMLVLEYGDKKNEVFIYVASGMIIEVIKDPVLFVTVLPVDESDPITITTEDK